MASSRFCFFLNRLEGEKSYYTQTAHIMPTDKQKGPSEFQEPVREGRYEKGAMLVSVSTKTRGGAGTTPRHTH